MPFAASHTFAVPSSLPVTIRVPSGLKHTPSTQPLLPLEGEDPRCPSPRPTPTLRPRRP